MIQTIERYKRMQGYRYHTLNLALRHVTCPSPPAGQDNSDPRQQLHVGPSPLTDAMRTNCSAM